MRKFLIVGCGGSGGATVRLLMDQLQADLRSMGISKLPAAWQFLHVDVPVDPDRGPGPIGNIVEMGGHHVSFSSPTNTYTATSLNVEAQLASMNQNNFAPLVGWEPRDRHAANAVPVVGGAGQYRAIGRMLTLPRLGHLRSELEAAQSRAVAPDAWGEIPVHLRTSDVIYPIVVSSMAGGSGASMFLDVCRLLGTLPGINPATISCLVYTADVFGELPEAQRANVEGNALAAVSEVIASISRLAEADDARLIKGMGISANVQGVPPFARLIPIGRRIGGAGAMFGDGSMSGVYRGIGRALAGVIMSESASQQYTDYTVGNPTPLPTKSDDFGWGVSEADLPFGSLGFASLSLGRDRYLDYAAQRLARVSVDHLLEGHLSPTSSLPSSQQLDELLNSQWTVSLSAMGLPAPGTATPMWFQSVALPAGQSQAIARDALQSVSTALSNIGQAPATGWLAAARSAANSQLSEVTGRLVGGAYAWAENWGGRLETGAKAEFVRVTSAFGLPYARALMERVKTVCGGVAADMAAAGQTASATDPLLVKPTMEAQATALKKEQVSSQHALGTLLMQSFQEASESRIRREAAAVGAQVLTSFANDVLATLATAANDAIQGLEHARAQQGGAGGLAQLHSEVYADWPGSEEQPNPRWDQAQNEVLLTTAADFPRQFVADVTVSGDTGTYTEALAKTRTEVISGQWATAGSRTAEDVLEQVGHWRPSALPVDSATRQPQPPAKPSYQLRFRASDVLVRSRCRLEAPGDVFHAFATQSIVGYLDDPQVADVVRERRRATFISEFARAMALARPLVGVDPQMVQRLHPNTNGVQYTYAFSEIPFGANHPVAEKLQLALNGNHELSRETVAAFTSALEQGSEVRKVGIFGSYGKYSPLCFTSLLVPIRDRWASADAQFRRSLWRWKRTRPVGAGLAMSPEEAVRVTAGWYLGRLLGLVRGDFGMPVQVATVDGWLTISDFLEGPEVGQVNSLDVLPAVLGSHAWAVVRCAEDPDLGALKPYSALRKLVDSSDTNESVPLSHYVGTSLLRQAFFGSPLTVMAGGQERAIVGDPSTLLPLDAVKQGTQSSGLVPPQPASDWGQQPAAPSWTGQPPAMDGSTTYPPPHESAPAAQGQGNPVATALLQWIETMRNYFLGANGHVRRDESGSYVSTVRSVNDLRQLSLHAEVGPLILQALDLIEAMAQLALQQGPPGGVSQHDVEIPRV